MKRSLILFFACVLTSAAALGQANQNNFPGTGSAVPGVANSGGNVTLNIASGMTVAPDANGTVYVDGTRFTNLCGALAYAAANVSRRFVIHDFNTYEAWAKDPFNDATCGNAAVSNLSASVYLHNGNFIQGTGATVVIPNTVEFYLEGRAAESQLSTSNGCGTANPVQCQGTLIIAYNTAAPFTGGNAMTCAGCTVLASGSAVLTLGNGTSSFGTVLQGPGTISCAGITNSIGVQNNVSQEQSFVFHLGIVGCQKLGYDGETASSQNSWIDDLEILSGNLTGGTIGTPPTFIGVLINNIGPNRHYGNLTCNTRGTATLAPIDACVKIINSRNGRIHDIHYETANYGVIVDGSSNVTVENVNTAAVFVPANIATASSNGSNTTTVNTTVAHNAINGGVTSTIAGTSTAMDGACTNVTVVTTTQYTCTQAIGVTSASTGTATLNGGNTIVRICGSASTAPCTSGNNSSNTVAFGLQKISPNLTLNAIIDDTNPACDGTIAIGNWTGFYQQQSLTAGAFTNPNVVYNTGSGPQTASVTATTMCSTGNAANTFLVGGYLDVSTAGTSCASNTTVILNALFTDPSSGVATTVALGTLTVVNNGAGGNNQTMAPVMIRAKANTNIQYSTTYTAGGSCAPSPAVRAFPILMKVANI